MTPFEIIRKAKAAPPDKREAVVTRLLKEYEGEDKELIEPWIWEALAVEPVDL